MKRIATLTLIAALLAVSAQTIFAVMRKASTREVIVWQEDWSAAATDNANQTPASISANYTSTGTNYAADNVTISSGTKIVVSGNASAGGTIPELLIARNGGSFTATVPMKGVYGDLTLTYKATKNLTVTATGATLGAKAAVGYNYDIPVTVAQGTEEITITFTQADDSNARLDDIKLSQIIVKESADLAWSTNEAEVTMGEPFTVTFDNPNDLTVNFMSDDTSVATVDDGGNITLVGPGTVTITATFDGDDAYDEQTVSVVLTVKAGALIDDPAVDRPMIEKTATFDFHNPETLTPTVNFNGGTVVSIADTPFTDGEARFEAKRSSVGYWPVLNKNIRPNWCGFQFPMLAAVVVSVPEGCELRKVDFTQGGYYDLVGSIKVTSTPEKGSYRQGVWTNGDDKGVTTLTLTNKGGSDASISKTAVTYAGPADVLMFNTMTPAMYEETDPFTGYTFYYDEPVEAATDAVFEVKDAHDNTVATLTPASEGNTLTLTPAEPIVKAGTYKLTIAAGAIRNAEGEFNRRTMVAFRVKDHSDSFNHIAVSLEPGQLKQLPQQLTLTYPEAIGSINSNKTATLTGANGNSLATPTLSIDTEDATKLIVDFGTDVTTVGKATLTLPAQTVIATDGEHFNKTVTLEWTILGYEPPTEAIIQRATDLLKLTGVGYPKQLSGARHALEAVVNGTGKSQQDYENAIESYLTTPDVVMPSIGKYYTMAKAATYDADALHFIGYADEAFYATDDADDAEHFLIVEIEGDRHVQTTDGKTHLVTFAKATDDVEPESAFGLLAVTIDGYTDTAEGRGYLLTETFSRDKKVTTEITPADGTKLDAIRLITVTVPEVEEIGYDETKPVIVLLDGEPVADAVEEAKVNGNQLILKVNLTATGTYTVKIQKGTMTFDSGDHTALVPEQTVSYEISPVYSFAYNFLSIYALYYTKDESTTYLPEEINDLTIFAKETDITINPDNNRFVVENLEGETVGEGTLRHLGDSIKTVGRSTIVLDLDTPFDVTNCPDGDYFFFIRRGSFGDSNYGRYLADNTSVARNECHLVTTTHIHLVVKSEVTGINDLDTATRRKADAVFDLTGRRITGTTKPGLYIVNGRKVIKK